MMEALAVDSRELLGIVYCGRCRQDTIPCERTGRCFFCEAPLAEPKHDPKQHEPIAVVSDGRARCRCGHGEGAHDSGCCAGCSCSVFIPAAQS